MAKQGNILAMPIGVYRNMTEHGPAFCAVIIGSYVNPWYGATAMEARRNADEWRKAEVAKLQKGKRAAPAEEVT